MKEPEKLQEIVPEYHSQNPIIRRLFHARIDMSIREAHITGPANILDVGCGEGILLKQLFENYPEVSLAGIDPHPDTLSLRTELPAKIQLFQASLLDAPFENASFDLIFCLDMLEHLQELEPACAKILALMKPGGKLIISAPTESFFYQFGRYLAKGTWSEIEGPGAGPHYWKASTLDAALRQHGFSRESRRTIPPLPPFDLFHINRYARSPG